MRYLLVNKRLKELRPKKDPLAKRRLSDNTLALNLQQSNWENMQAEAAKTAICHCKDNATCYIHSEWQ